MPSHSSKLEPSSLPYCGPGKRGSIAVVDGTIEASIGVMLSFALMTTIASVVFAAGVGPGAPVTLPIELVKFVLVASTVRLVVKYRTGSMATPGV